MTTPPTRRKPGSKVTAWENRSVTAQSGAIEAARILIAAN